MKTILMTISFLCLLIGASFSMANDVSDKGIWIDVRTAKEFNAGHLEHSTNIPHDVIGKHIAEVTTDKDAKIHLYCRSGGRAGTAKRALEGLGYTNVVNEGGYKDLLKRKK